MEESKENALQEKIKAHFEGKVVRKDLAKAIKGNVVVPTYVLEYLLGQYCTSFDEDLIQEGVDRVKGIIKDHFVHREESELIKSTIRERQEHRIIDKVSFKLNDKLDRYEAKFENLGLSRIPCEDIFVTTHPRLLSNEVWCIATLGYEAGGDGASPWHIKNLKPIQFSKIDLGEYCSLRSKFTTEEWIDLLLQTVGLNPEFFNQRTKLLQLSRLIPFVENNFNYMELGPKGTGKSHIFTEMSPHGILISGADVTQPKLFVNNSNSTIGLVGYWDVVSFDEFAGSQKKVDKKLVDTMKNYMANKSFNRGTGTMGATASFAFVGNTEHAIGYMLQHSHLFDALPQGYCDSAFLDRIHLYVPGWEVSKVRSEFFTTGYGFIVDYLAEALKELRKDDYSHFLKKHFTLNSELTTRDKDGISKTFSALVKLVFPGQEPTDLELIPLLEFALEGRLRVKENLLKIDETFEQVDFWYSTASDRSKKSIPTLESLTYGEGARKIAGHVDDILSDEKSEANTGSAPEFGSVPDKEEPNQASKPSILPGPKNDHISIRDNQTGITYQKLFAPYLRGVSKITIQDPYIRAPHQMRNLLEFIMVAHQNRLDDEILEIHLSTFNTPDKIDISKSDLQDIASSLEPLDIHFTFSFEETHDRWIETNAGWKISLGRGLDIFEKPEGRFNISDLAQQFRKCRGCEIVYFQSRR